MATREWAKARRRFHRKDGARPGPWESEPGQDEIMDAWDDPRVRRVVVMLPSQVGGKSAMMGNCMGRIIDLDPANMMVLYPTIKAAERYAKSRFEPMCEATPSLAVKVPTRKARTGEQTILHRQFDGGQLFINGANAPADLAAQTVRYLFADEVDRYEASAGVEGDPLDLAEQRLVDYGEFAKVWLSSTPTIAGVSRIERAWEQGDRQVRQAKCRHCEEYFELLWQHVIFKDPATGEKRAELAHVECPLCGACWTEADRRWACRNARWERTGEFDGTASFKENAFVCVRADLVAIARRFLNALGNPEQEKAFANTVECRTWSPKADAPKWEHLRARRETWSARRLPEGATILTCGVDVQKDRLEGRLWAWGEGGESWHVDSRVYLGSTARDDVWANLDALLDETWETVGGVELPLDRLAVDMNAFTEDVFRWAQRHRATRRLMLVRGDPRQSVVLGMPVQTEATRKGKRSRYGMRHWPVGVDRAKEWFYGKLDLPFPAEGEPFPKGYVHLSTRTSDDELRQLTSEERRTVKDKYGRLHTQWHVKPGVRNEGLDARNYAYAGAIEFGLWRLSEAGWARLRAERGTVVAKAAKPAAEVAPQAVVVAAEQQAQAPQPRTGWSARGPVRTGLGRR